VDDLGDPVAYLAVTPGTPVYAADGTEVGRVEAVVADDDADIFEGLAVDVDGDTRFADAEVVRSMHERGVILDLDAASAAELPDAAER
jgi:sporulation protein YlmC with PRC-barrel domain